MKCLLYSRIDSKTFNVWFIIFASFVGCHPWHMLLIFEREIMYVHYKKLKFKEMQTMTMGENIIKTNKREGTKILGAIFHTKMKKKNFLEFIVMKIWIKNECFNKLWSCTLGSNGIKGTNHVIIVINKVNWNTFVCWEVLNIVATNC